MMMCKKCGKPMIWNQTKDVHRQWMSFDEAQGYYEYTTMTCPQCGTKQVRRMQYVYVEEGYEELTLSEFKEEFRNICWQMWYDKPYEAGVPCRSE